MNWNAAGDWLASHREGRTFHGPAPFTPDGPCCPDCGAPEGVVCDCQDQLEDEQYRHDWRRRVDSGSLDWAAECDAGNVDIMSMIPLDWWDGRKS